MFGIELLTTMLLEPGRGALGVGLPFVAATGRAQSCIAGPVPGISPVANV